MNAPVRSLRRNILHSVAGNAMFTLAQLGVIVIVARLGTPEEVGALTFASALVVPLFMLAQMGLREGHAVDDLDYYTRSDYAALRVLTTLAASIVAAVLVVTYQSQAGWLVQATTLAVALLRIVDSRANFCRSIYQRAERMDFYAVSMLLQGAGGLVGFAIAYWATRDLPLAVLAQAVSVGCCVLLFDRGRLTKLGAHTPLSAVLRSKPAKLARLFWWMLPLGLSATAVRAAIGAPAIVLERYADLATLGQFGAILYFGTAAIMASNAVGVASVRRLRRLYKAGDPRAFRRLALSLTTLSAILGGCIVAVAWVVGGDLLAAIFGEQYRNTELFALVMLAFALRLAGAPLQVGLTAGQAFRYRLAISGAALLTAVVTAVGLVPAYSAYGAAAALVAAELVSFVITAAACLALSRRIGPAGDPSA